MCVALLPASAAGVTLTAASPEIDSATGGFADASVSWTTASDYAIGDTIRVTITWSDTTGTPQHGSSTAIAGCTTPSTNLSGTFGSLTDTSAVFTLDTARGSGLAADLCVSVPVEDAGVLYDGNFSLAIITSNVGADYGAAEFYVNGGNDVLVDASVQPTLEFAVVSSTDVGVEQHECHMGTLTLTDVGRCDYRLRVSTNAANGFSVSISSNKEFSTAAYATLTNVTNGTYVTAGTEGYGISVTGTTIGGNNGSGSYVNPIVETAPFNADDVTVPQASTPFLSYGNSFLGTSTLSTTLVEHRAAIDAATVVGFYQQTVTYTVSPTF
ncbi:MAG: hypothetical protein P1P90_02330 [Patescibacteria group bacterium]|nr:hypothetical protein [Patescibacteria group bacterium]